MLGPGFVLLRESSPLLASGRHVYVYVSSRVPGWGNTLESVLKVVTGRPFRGGLLRLLSAGKQPVWVRARWEAGALC